MNTLIKVLVIIIVLVLALWVLSSVVIAAPFGLILKILVVVIAIVGLLSVAGIIPSKS